MVNTPQTIELKVDPMFSGLFAMQVQFQARLLGGQHPALLTDEAKMQYIRTMALALTDELHEALGETGWKDWAASNHLNRDAYMGELADVFIFLMNLMMVAQITPTNLMDVVKAKIMKNHQRQDNGYDGVTEKCPGCRRAYDDNAVKCNQSTPRPQGSVGWCDAKQSHVNKHGALL